MAKKEPTKTVIGKNSFFQGKFYINGELQVDGKFEGTSLHVDHLHIGETGKVKSNIKTSTAIIEGIIIGNITATSRVMLLPTARILGNIKTPELIIQKGVIMEGKCNITNDMEHSASDIINKLYEGK